MKNDQGYFTQIPVKTKSFSYAPDVGQDGIGTGGVLGGAAGRGGELFMCDDLYPYKQRAEEIFDSCLYGFFFSFGCIFSFQGLLLKFVIITYCLIGGYGTGTVWFSLVCSNILFCKR